MREQGKTAIRYHRTFPLAQIVFSQAIQTLCDGLGNAFKTFFPA